MPAPDLHLAIDIGNSRLTCGLFAGEDLIETWNYATNDPATAAFHLNSQTHRLKGGHITLSSVVPEASRVLLQDLKYDKKNITVLHPQKQHVIVGVYKTMGTDRLANAVAAYYLYRDVAPAIVVVDFGTATTLTAVDATGQFMGGMITLGLSKTFAALHAATAQLPELSVQEAEILSNPLAFDTQRAIERGCVIGHIGLVRYWLERAMANLPKGTKAIATGGLAPLIAPHADLFSEIDVQLTLKGVRYLGEAAMLRGDRD
ncbi:MAG: type III pantothenate kinase [Candidatus Melainabacteria bacterium]|jgi:type III pantothenate kinase|nr:type III pantothenate kinase [Candidatus Melainabacteria bacterium]MBX9674381.1 type III pantothenate kinase [Candidatus Obscuribacterales bacterium]